MNSFFTVLKGKACGIIMAFGALLFTAYTGQAQLNVTPGLTASQLAQLLTGSGVIIMNTSLTCPSVANGSFSITGSPFGIDSGIVMTSGRAQTIGATPGVNGTPSLFATTSNNAPGDANLTALAGQTTNDACVLQFDFIPAGDTIKFDYVFGSEEYNGPHGNYNCSINDIFAFFISGPGITGLQNIALIPGTNIPVGVSTVNDGVGASVGNPCYVNTNNNGPYTQYYNTNTSAASPLTYSGYTDVFTAIKAVIPCDTYHLKLAIADASDFIFDSGVFLKAGSLNSTAIGVTPVGGGGLASPTPYCVRNCLPGKFVFTRPASKPTPLTIHYLIQGTAVNGSDYTLIPDSVVIPANSTVAQRLIYAVAPPFGTKTVVLKVLSPYTCSNNQVNVIDSATLIILDSLHVNILNNDTTICYGQSVPLFLEQFPGDTSLTFAWSPTAGLNNPNIKNPIATPLVTTTYVVSGTQTGAGCPPSTDRVKITVQQPAAVNAGPDRTTCIGTPFQFNVTTLPANQTYTYSWTPGTSLSSTTVANPVFTPTAVTPFVSYVVTADPGAAGCTGKDTVRVRVLPGDITLLTADTAICKGATVRIRAIGDPAFTYLWTPTADVSNPFTINPDITPDTTRTYTVTASYPTCPSKTHSLTIDVQPNPIVSLGPDRTMCQWDTIQINSVVNPGWYTHYAYTWTPDSALSSGTTPSVIFSGQTSATITLTVQTPAGCKGSDDIFLTVFPGNFASLVPTKDTGVCPRDSVQLIASGGVQYQWTPDFYLNNPNIPNPISHPGTSVLYTVLVTDVHGCFDTLNINIDVHPEALLSIADSVTLYPGETYQMDPAGNCLYFSWFPPLGLTNPNIANPVASPAVNTRYYINGATEWGCRTTDSIDVYIDPETPIDVPNAFSPGSDPNGEIKVMHRGIATLNYFRIFNRWGTKVFESSDINHGWNGQYNGVPQPMGVYVYVVEAFSATGRRFYKQGNITLIR